MRLLCGLVALLLLANTGYAGEEGSGSAIVYRGKDALAKLKDFFTQHKNYNFYEGCNLHYEEHTASGDPVDDYFVIKVLDTDTQTSVSMSSTYERQFQLSNYSLIGGKKVVEEDSFEVSEDGDTTTVKLKVNRYLFGKKIININLFPIFGSSNSKTIGYIQRTLEMERDGSLVTGLKFNDTYYRLIMGAYVPYKKKRLVTCN